MGAIAEGFAEYHGGPRTSGWAVAICLAFSAMSFIVSRFVAGMAKQPAWQNLRGGAAYMVGNALVRSRSPSASASASSTTKTSSSAIAYAIPIFMMVLAARSSSTSSSTSTARAIAGETPRPAFDSKLLSLFSAPDNLVRSINEAVNYQFGFDITELVGLPAPAAQLRLADGGLGVVALVACST